MKQFVLLLLLVLTIASIASSQSSASIRVQVSDPGATISRHIYGHFSEHLGRCIYDGFWVSDTSTLPRKDRIRLDIVEALRKIRIPNLRWPGGCFADEYHWRDGVGPRPDRPRMINTNWGNVMEDNSFGTHEFLELCELLGAEPYICGNVGSGTVEEMSKWVEYLNFDGLSPMTEWRAKNGRPKPWNVQYWGVGNENWGCGGNMTAEFYADQYRRYASYAKDYPGTVLRKIAGGPSSADYHWTETLMKKIPLNLMWGISLHHYVVPNSWADKGSATRFDEAEYARSMQKCLFMEELISKHSTIMDRYDPQRKVALVVDEWGIWTNPEPGTNPAFLFQQNSIRDALVAASTLNIFNNHSERVKMANLAQTVNVLQALILTKGKQMLLTPTYYVFDLFQVHQEAKKLDVRLNSPGYGVGADQFDALNVSASVQADGIVYITIVNLDPQKTISSNLFADMGELNPVAGKVLSGKSFTDYNSFERPDAVIIQPFRNFQKVDGKWQIKLPPLSVVQLQCKAAAL
jgi:alpha-N-arabinofuranosidase